MEKGTRRPTVAPLRSKPTRRWARQACRRHQRDRSRPWRAPNPGEIDEELNGDSSWSTSRPPRLPDAAAASSARVGFLFGVLRRPLRARQGRQGYSSSASGRVLYSETDTTAAKSPFPPRAREPRRAAAASVFDVGAPVEAGPPPPPLAEGAVAAPGPTELRRREAGGGMRAAPGRVPSG